MDIAGHVSTQMLKHYSHIRMEAKRRAVAALSPKFDGAVQSPRNDHLSTTTLGDRPVADDGSTDGCLRPS